MRVLVDENVPFPSVRQLRAAGYDVESVAELAPGMADLDVLAHAHQHQQLLLTFDRDFGELIYRRGATVPAGVLYLRFIPATPEEPGVIIRDLLETKALSMRDRFTVVQRERIRQRPLPKVM
ncbi:hypothetical protein BH23GEM4_BH23GEM4_20130 [soil metagenome]